MLPLSQGYMEVLRGVAQSYSHQMGMVQNQDLLFALSLVSIHSHTHHFVENDLDSNACIYLTNRTCHIRKSSYILYLETDSLVLPFEYHYSKKGQDYNYSNQNELLLGMSSQTDALNTSTSL